MAIAPALQFRKRGSPRGTVARGGNAKPIQIFAPDRYSTALLLEHAAPVFPAEIPPGLVWSVRLQPPTDGGWALELLSLVQRWLDAAGLPGAHVLYGDRSYRIRPSTDVTQFAEAVGVPRELPAHASRWRARLLPMTSDAKPAPAGKRQASSVRNGG